jgi:hypothetical protein
MPPGLIGNELTVPVLGPNMSTMWVMGIKSFQEYKLTSVAKCTFKKLFQNN